MITKAIKAKYVGGLLKLLERVRLPEGEEVIIHIQTRDPKDKIWLKMTSQNLSNRLTKLEADLPKEKVASWHKAINQVSRPARYIPGKGIVVN